MKWIIVYSSGANTPSKAFGPFDTHDQAAKWHKENGHRVPCEYMEFVKLFAEVKE